jgi:hypothetical protein
MPTEKQIAANRENAKKSTGPRTETGKSKVRLNAKRDGITGQVITLPAEDLPIFEKLKADLIAELNPQTLLEQKLASAIAWDTWRLDRLRAVEMNLFALGSQEEIADTDNPQIDASLADAQTFQRESQKFALMSIYEQRLSRGIHKNIAALKDLRKEREANRREDLREEANIARTKDFKGLPYEAPVRPSQNGFVFSTAEVLAEANRETITHDSALKVLFTEHKIQFDGAWENYKPNPVPDRPNSGLKLAAAA